MIAAVFSLAVDLALLRGAKDINKLEGAYVCAVDDQWTFAINGTKEPVTVDLVNSMGVTDLKPFHMAVWFNGWLAGLLTMNDGTLCAGEAGNEDNLIKALEASIAVEKLAKEMA